MRKYLLTVFMFVLCVCFGFASNAQANKYTKGFLVPYVQYNHQDVDTVVGLICKANSIVYWTMFDGYSHHILDGTLHCTENDLVMFSANQEFPASLKKQGYLVFTSMLKAEHNSDDSPMLTDDGAAIAGNAFIVDAANSDAVFLPVVQLVYSDYASGVDLTKMNGDSIVSLSNGLANNDGFVDVRFWIDPEFSASTRIIIWTTDCLKITQAENENCYLTDAMNPELYCHAFVFDEDEHWMSLSVNLGCELTVIDPTCIEGFPEYPNGFIRFNKSELMTRGSGAFVFSYINSPRFNATQTLMPAESCGEEIDSGNDTQAPRH